MISLGGKEAMGSNSTEMPRILVLEDDPDLCSTIVSYLNFSGFVAEGVQSVTALAQRPIGRDVDLVVVDLGLPDGDGLQVVESIRSSGRQGIVIMTARSQTEDRLKGYAYGADHYLVKPVDLRELVVVLRAVFDRLHINRSVWLLNETECRLIAPSGASLRLTQSEYKVIKALALRAGTAVSRADVSAALGLKYDDFIVARLEIMIRRLRGKIKDAIGGESPIKTVRSIGYAFAAAIKIV